MVLVLERKDGLQKEPRRGLRFVGEETVEQPVIAEVEENSDGTATFSGYFLRWDDVAEIMDFFGEYNERFERGAFTKTFAERGPQGNNAIKMLRQHEQRFGTFIAGKFTDLREDSVGPAFEGRTIDTETGRNLAVELREGVINTMSIGFDAMREEYIKDENTFVVKEAKLYEASPVYWPAYESATIESVRSLDVLAPALARFLTVLEGGGELNEEQIGQLNMIRARISAILDEPRATTLVEGIQAQDQLNTRAGDDPHADQQSVVLARLRLAEIEGIAS